MNTDNQDGCMQYVPQLREKIGWKLFPPNYVDTPELPAGTIQMDVFHAHTHVHFSFLDRLRILISGNIEVTTKTATENQLGNHVTASCVQVIPPKFLQRREK